MLKLVSVMREVNKQFLEKMREERVTWCFSLKWFIYWSLIVPWVESLPRAVYSFNEPVSELGMAIVC